MSDDPAVGTPGWLEAVAARADAATPGPWVAAREQNATEDGWEPSSYLTGQVLGPADAEPDDSYPHDYVLADAGSETDAAFIAHARTDVVDLIAHIRSVEASLASAEAALGAVRRLHSPQPWRGDDTDLVCSHCLDRHGLPEPYPCPTVVALDGHGGTT